jgi:hypothetical protein
MNAMMYMTSTTVLDNQQANDFYANMATLMGFADRPDWLGVSRDQMRRRYDADGQETALLVSHSDDGETASFTVRRPEARAGREVMRFHRSLAGHCEVTVMPFFAMPKRVHDAMEVAKKEMERTA